MILSDEDAALFYRAWGALLTWVNDQRQIVPRFPRPALGAPIEPALALRIRDVVWADDSLRERFLADGAADLGAAERELVASWRHRVRGQFVLFNHLQKHSIFMSEAVYGVRGIYSPLAMMFPSVPMFVQAVLIPFRDVIITDGLLQTQPMHITFGGGVRRMFKDQYSAARTAGRILTSLPARAEPGPQAAAPVARRPPPRRRTTRARRP